MPIPQIILVTFASALSLIGAYSILREALLGVFASREVSVTVILKEPVTPEALDILLDEATRHPRRRRGQRVTLVLPRALMDTMGEGDVLLPSYAEQVSRYGAEVFLGDILPTPVLEEEPEADETVNV